MVRVRPNAPEGEIGVVTENVSGVHAADAPSPRGTCAPRYWAALAYAVLAAVATAEVVLQGFLFSGFYGRGEQAFIDAHGIAGELTSYILVVVVVPLAFIARFPSGQRIAWWTVLLAAMWFVQAHLLGYGIERIGRWLAMVHIPMAFALLLLALYLTGRARAEVKAMSR